MGWNSFEWVHEALPSNFIAADVIVGRARHVIMTTPDLKKLLQSTRNWAADATFKAVQKPFAQLWTIRTFIVQDGCVKQVILCAVLMSRRSKKDYKAVINAILNLPDIAEVKVKTIMMDFEAAVWMAFRELMPDVVLRGCSFHWTNAVWKRAVEEKLKGCYIRKTKTGRFLRRLLCLPFLPAEQIPATFQAFQDLIKPHHPEGLHKLMDYVQSQWIENAVWTPAD